MKKNILMVTFVAGCMLISSCASKKDLVNCQTENKELTGKYQDTKDRLAESNAQLAASNARVASLEEQLAESKRAYAALQGSLDKSLSNTSANNLNISKLVDQIN